MATLTKKQMIDNLALNVLYIGADDKFDKKKELARKMTETYTVFMCDNLLDTIWDELEYLDGRTNKEQKQVEKVINTLEKLQGQMSELSCLFAEGDKRGLCRGKNVF